MLCNKHQILMTYYNSFYVLRATGKLGVNLLQLGLSRSGFTLCISLSSFLDHRKNWGVFSWWWQRHQKASGNREGLWKPRLGNGTPLLLSHSMSQSKLHSWAPSQAGQEGWGGGQRVVEMCTAFKERKAKSHAKGINIKMTKNLEDSNVTTWGGMIGAQVS